MDQKAFKEDQGKYNNRLADKTIKHLGQKFYNRGASSGLDKQGRNTGFTFGSIQTKKTGNEISNSTD